MAKKPAARKRRFDQRDFDYIAQYVIETFESRKSNRADLEKQWKEIDRQVLMEPDIAFKTLPNGKIDADKKWMAEMELPLQSQALEVLTADARRMQLPDSGSWFKAHAETTDEYFEHVDFTSMILGDQNDIPSIINQDNADKLVEGFLMHNFRQYDHPGHMDRINAEAFKYGMGVGRGRLQTKSVYTHTNRGVVKVGKKIPVLTPTSIKHLYLDEPMPSMHSAQVLGEAHIAEDYIKLEGLKMAANRGSNNPDDMDGGWMPDNVKKLEADDKGYVRILEMEGDIVVPRKTVRSVVIPGAIVTVALGAASGTNEKATRSVVRFRFRKGDMSSWLLFPYHYESVDDAYPTSPLMKGRPVQLMATDALNRLMDSAALKNEPPIGYDRNDMSFASEGGPAIFPSAQWGTTDPLNVYSEIGGDPGALSGVLSMAINLYAELTGILPARLGAQTTSHTTAFAKDAELQRGSVRTVHYVKRSGEGPITRWLDMAYRLGRDSIGKNETVPFYIDAYGGFVDVPKRALPENVTFEWFGAGGPAEEQTRMQSRIQSLQLAIQLDQLQMQAAAQTGQPPQSKLNIEGAIREVLRKGHWEDVDAITQMQNEAVQQELPLGLPDEGDLAGLNGAGEGVSPGVAITALQNINDLGAGAI